MEAIVKRSAGLDVHKNNVVVTVLLEQEDGNLIEETKEFGTFLKHRLKLAEWLSEKAIESAVMESTGVYWKSIFEVLEQAGLKVYVVNARHIKQVPGRKTDVKDSQWLASLARYGLLRPSFIPPEDIRHLRLLTRRWQKVKGIIAGEKNRLHKVLDDGGIRLGSVVSDINGVSAQAIIDGLINRESPLNLMQHVKGRLKEKIPQLLDSLEGPLSDSHIFLLEEIRVHIQYLESQLQTLWQEIEKRIIPYKEQWEILQTIPGIDKVSAAILLAETGTDMERFGSAAQLASWAGMCPGNNESAGKRKSGRTRKGNRSIRQVLCEISNAAHRTDSQFKGKYKGLVIRRGHKRTIVAIGHKILRIIFTLLRDLTPYHDPAVDYEELMVKRNAPRWIKALKNFGYLLDNPAVALA
jgi:transposase